MMESSGRRTFTSPLSTWNFINAFALKAVLPLGPSTFTVSPSTVTLTFSGIFTGSLPMRDMGAPTRRCR